MTLLPQDPPPVMPRDHEWTVADLEQLPDDGLRYELCDGVLLVSGSPSKAHQRAQRGLFLALLKACPPDHEVFVAPMAFQPTHRRSFQPDLCLARRDDPSDDAVRTPLLLAVEVLSPSTRSVDLLLKFGVYAESGVQAYWVVDPLEPSVTAWSLVEGSYVAAGSATGADGLELAHPFPVRIVPAELLT